MATSETHKPAPKKRSPAPRASERASLRATAQAEPERTSAASVAPSVSKKRVTTDSSLPEASGVAEAAAAKLVEDLGTYLALSGDPRRRLKFVASKTGIHEKTLNRIAHKLNRPTYMTVFKVYRHLLNEVDDAKLLSRVPTEIATYLKKANPQSFESDKVYSPGLEKELHGNPIAAEIVILCATGPLKTSFIKKRFGDYGLTVVASLVERQILNAVSHDQVCSGKVQLNMSPEAVVSFGIQMSRSYLRPQVAYEAGENFIGFYAEGLTEEARQKWLAIDAEAFNKKVSLAKLPENRGELRAFTFYATDVVDTGESK